MRFTVCRTSTYGEGKPCAEAYEATIPDWDYRTFKTFEEYEERFGEPFTAEGTEHELMPGRGIKRRRADQTVWMVDIPDLDALMAFWKKYGDLVLTTPMGNDAQPELEIYDGWRE